MHPGDDLLAFISGAIGSVTLIAPFMTVSATDRVLSAIPAEVAEVTLVTRWIPDEIAAGVSDLEVFDLVKTRPGAKLLLNPRNHAKLFIADGKYMLGSANVTDKALSWVKNPNLELLVPWEDQKKVETFLDILLGEAYTATAEIRDVVASLIVGRAPPPKIPAPWLPRCASPADLWKIYEGSDESTTRP